MAPRKIALAGYHVALPETVAAKTVIGIRKNWAILRETRDDLLANHFTGTHNYDSMFSVYVLRSANRVFYIGYSANLRKRLADHTLKRVSSTKGADYQLVYYEAYINKMDAVMREKFLKSGSGHRYLNKQLVHFLSDENNSAGVV